MVVQLPVSNFSLLNWAEILKTFPEAAGSPAFLKQENLLLRRLLTSLDVHPCPKIAPNIQHISLIQLVHS